jgi:hypothetical protein
MARDITVHGGTIIKLQEIPGHTVEGEYRGMRQTNPQYAPLGDFLTAAGPVSISCPKQLQMTFAGVAIGTRLRVTWLEKVAIAGGKTMNKYRVEDLSDGEAVGAAPAPGPVPASTGEYAVLADMLRAANPSGADVQLGALGRLHADPVARLAALKGTLRAQGVTV